VRAFHF
jgi:hypothetical protein